MVVFIILDRVEEVNEYFWNADSSLPEEDWKYSEIRVLEGIVDMETSEKITKTIAHEIGHALFLPHTTKLEIKSVMWSTGGDYEDSELWTLPTYYDIMRLKLKLEEISV